FRRAAFIGSEYPRNFAAVMQRDRAGLQALRRDELEAPRAFQALKQGRPVAREDRMDDETVLVDQPQPLERGRERGASHEQAARGLLLELAHGLEQIPLDAEGVVPREVAAR